MATSLKPAISEYYLKKWKTFDKRVLLHKRENGNKKNGSGIKRQSAWA